VRRNVACKKTSGRIGISRFSNHKIINLAYSQVENKEAVSSKEKEISYEPSLKKPKITNSDSATSGNSKSLKGEGDFFIEEVVVDTLDADEVEEDFSHTIVNPLEDSDNSMAEQAENENDDEDDIIMDFDAENLDCFSKLKDGLTAASSSSVERDHNPTSSTKDLELKVSDTDKTQIHLNVTADSVSNHLNKTDSDDEDDRFLKKAVSDSSSSNEAGSNDEISLGKADDSNESSANEAGINDAISVVKTGGSDESYAKEAGASDEVSSEKASRSDVCSSVNIVSDKTTTSAMAEVFESISKNCERDRKEVSSAKIETSKKAGRCEESFSEKGGNYQSSTRMAESDEITSNKLPVKESPPIKLIENSPKPDHQTEKVAIELELEVPPILLKHDAIEVHEQETGLLAPRPPQHVAATAVTGRKHSRKSQLSAEVRMEYDE